MAIYIPKYNGYMIDVADQVFVRCDGTPFYFNEASQTNFADTMNSLTINGGSSKQARAIIDTNRETTFTFTSAQFSADMFEMANNTKATDADYGAVEANMFTAETSGTAVVVNLPFEVQASSVMIRGLNNVSADTEGGFVVTFTPAAGTTGPVTTITFHEGEVTAGDEIRVFYKRRIANAHIIKVLTTSTTSKGALHARWGVYSDGMDCTEASLKGYFHLYIPRVRVTQMPGFDNSYKSAATNAVAFTAMDAKRADKTGFDFVYEALDSNGDYVTDYTGTMTWNS